jgi:microcystin-dependent protein
MAVTFALPNLQGRAQLSQGQGPGLSPYDLGQQSGTETVTLIQTEMPAHNHLVNVVNGDGNQGSPSGNLMANQLDANSSAGLSYQSGTPNAVMNPMAVGVGGGNQAHNNMQPYLVLTYIIATEGIFPSRN